MSGINARNREAELQARVNELECAIFNCKIVLDKSKSINEFEGYFYSHIRKLIPEDNSLKPS